MKTLALAAVWAVAAGAAAPVTQIPLQPLTEAEVGADALEKSACYAHRDGAVLVVASKINAAVMANGDFFLLSRRGKRDFPADGARYGVTSIEVVIAPAAGPAETVAGRIVRPAEIRVIRGRHVGSVMGRWSCAANA